MQRRHDLASVRIASNYFKQFKLFWNCSKIAFKYYVSPASGSECACVLTSATVLQRLSHLPKFNTQAWLDNLVMQGIAKLSCWMHGHPSRIMERLRHRGSVAWAAIPAGGILAPRRPRDHAGAAVVCAYRACLLSSSQNSTRSRRQPRPRPVWLSVRIDDDLLQLAWACPSMMCLCICLC